MTSAEAARAPETRRVLDVTVLPRTVFGHQGLIWWGTTGFMVIEGSMFVMVIIVYFYLRLQVSEWPPSLPNPGLLYGTANLLLVFVSLIPAVIAKKKAEAFDLAGVRLWLGILVAFGVVSVVLRAFEYTALNCRWDDNAYGSIVWVLLSLHTTHVATDVADSAVLLTLAFTGPNSKKRFVDYSENSLYWYFIVSWWVPIYLTIYFMPRWL
jgi:heme/copper-type cytochrome/quinol oxidase subunit 3